MVINIIMPVYNTYSGFIQEAIDSIKNQSLKSWTLIIVDDASHSPDTIKYLKNIKDEKIRLLTLSENLGEMNARMYAKNFLDFDCKYVAFMDSDDIMLPERLEKQFNFLIKNEDVDVLGCQVQFFSDKNNIKHAMNAKQSFTSHSFNVNNFIFTKNWCINNPTTMMKKEILQTFDSNIITYFQKSFNLHKNKFSDFIFYSTLVKVGHKIRNLDEILLIYRLHDSQISRNTHIISRTTGQILEVGKVNEILRKKIIQDTNICFSMGHLTLLPNYEIKEYSDEQVFQEDLWTPKRQECSEENLFHEDFWAPRERRKEKGNRIGFLSLVYMPIGGTETFHQCLLSRLRHVVDIAGFVSTHVDCGGDGLKLHVPYATGLEAAKRLAAHCDIIVSWGIGDLASILPENRPRVIAVHHSEWSSGWSNDQILQQSDIIDEIICVNEDVVKNLAVRGMFANYVPNAIDPNRIIPSGNQINLRMQFGIPKESKIVLFGHRMSVEKRPLLAIEIARHLPEDWVMVITGDGPELSKVKDATCHRVRIVGVVESLADWLSISDCFLSLSILEGFGLAIAEAMGAGVPVVSTPVGIAPGLATTLEKDSTPEEWAAAILTSKRIVEPQVILDMFNIERMVNSWAGIINAITLC